MDDRVDWSVTHKFVANLMLPANLPTAGTAEWSAANDDTKTKALLIAGDRWVLEQNMLYLRRQRAEMKFAAIEIAQAKSWAQVGRQLAQRNAWYRDNPWAARQIEGKVA